MNVLEGKLARAIVAGFFTPEEAAAVAELVSFHAGVECLLTQNTGQEFLRLMRPCDGFVQALRPREPRKLQVLEGMPPDHSHFCKGCGSAGFEPSSRFPGEDRCTFCDGTEGGVPEEEAKR